MTEQKSIPSNLHGRIAWIVLALLLTLRIPFTFAIIYSLPIENQNGAAFYEIGTYLLTAFLIWWERERLAEFHIDSLALAFIILLRPLQTLILGYWRVETPLAFPKPLGLSLWAISIGLFVSLRISGFRPARLSTRTSAWLAAGLAAGVCISAAENLGAFLSAIKDPARGTGESHLLVSSSLTLLYHLGFAPINEEPLFRGFLWGFLRRRGWKEGWILPFQAALFGFAHVYFASQYPLRFWLFIPFSGILFGLFAWRSRSIAPAMLAHGLINGSVYVLVLALIPLFL